MEHRKEVALIVDFENIRESARAVYGTELPPSLLIEKARKYGLVHVARAYADFDQIPQDVQREMQICGLTVVHARAHEVGERRRSAADMELVLDLVETLLDRASIPTVILMSGDRDFLRLVTMVRNRFGKEVVISGVPGTVSADLIDAAGGNFDPLEIPGLERRATADESVAEAPRVPGTTNGATTNGGTAAPSQEAAPAPAYAPPTDGYGRRATPDRSRLPRPAVRPARYEPRTENGERAARPDRDAAFGRRPVRTARPAPEPPRPALPQPDVEEEIGAESAGESTPAWQRGKLAERAEAIQRMMNERRAAGEPLPAGWGGEVNWKKGDVVEGIVKSITDFGAFLEIGGVDALLHVSQMAWQHVRHPSQIVQVGDKIQVQVLEMDEASGRVSVGLKQLTPDPWVTASARYEVGHRTRGRVSGVKEYGVFVELEPGIFGLLHISNIFPQPWGHHPSELYRLDQDVEIVVAKLDADMRRLAFVLPESEAARDLSARPAGVLADGSDAGDDEAAETALRFMEGEDAAE